MLYQASGRQLLEMGLAQLGEAADQTMPVGRRPLGEARDIFDGGGRYVSILGTNPLFHHPADRWPDALDLPKTESLVGAMVELALGLANTQ